MNENLLKAKIIEKGSSIKELSEMLGIAVGTFYRKISSNYTCEFTLKEIKTLSNALALTNKELNSIFFD